MDKKQTLYVVCTEQENIGLVRATSASDAKAKAKGKGERVKSAHKATEEEIAWIKAMGGRIPK